MFCVPNLAFLKIMCTTAELFISMPRRYYYRRSRTAKPKRKWASHIKTWSGNSITTNPATVELVENSTMNAPTPTIIKTGNFKVSLDMYATYNVAQTVNLGCNAYILFVPQGVSVSGTLITNHPEWILAAKSIGSTYATDTTKVSLETLNMSSRMKRNLNSGDKVVLYLQMIGDVVPNGIMVNGLVRYWTCAN